MKIFIILIFFVLGTESNQASQFIKHLAENEASPAAAIEQVSWISGHWVGEAMGGLTEEIWSSPQANSMMCVFRFSKDGEVQFYEIEIIREIGNSLVLELKHFSNELKGWEKKDEVVSFPLVRLSENAAYFDGLTFLKISENELHVYVENESEGKSSEIRFIYKRAKM